MKKITSLMLILVLAAACFSLAACDKNDGTAPETPDKGYKINEELVGSDYVDYAGTVYVNSEKYPQLAGQGLSIVTGYESDGDCIEVAADDEHNIQEYFDETLPSIVIIHGILLNGGRYCTGNAGTENRAKEVNSSIYKSENELEYLASDPVFRGNHDMSKYWKDGGNDRQAYNIFFFHYERFADVTGLGDDLLGQADGPTVVQNRIWSRTNGVHALYMDGDEVKQTADGEALGGYSIAEFFAAEYARTFNFVDTLYPEYKDASSNIFVASHSMGGVVSVASNILLKLIADDGQIAHSLTPNRLLQMDSYLGSKSDDTENEIGWTGKLFPLDSQNCHSETEAYLSSLEALALKYGVAIDFYMNQGYGVPFMCLADWNNEYQEWTGERGEDAERVLAVSAMVLLHPYFADVDGMVFTTGHNSIREWVLSSYLYDAPKVTVDGKTYTVPTANMSNTDVIAARGTFYEMCCKKLDGTVLEWGEYGDKHSETIRCDDDVFVKLK